MSTYQGGMPERCILCGAYDGVSGLTGFCPKCDNKVLAHCDTDALRRDDRRTNVLEYVDQPGLSDHEY